MQDRAFNALTAEQIVAAEGAKRLLSDQIFHDTLNEIVGMATERAIVADDPGEREQNRQLILAIAKIKTTLQTAIEHVEGAKQAAQTGKAFE